MFKIVTDNTVDMPVNYLEEHDIGVLNLKCLFGEEELHTDSEEESKVFYDMMRAGKMPTTSQINPEEAKAFLEKLSKDCNEILYIVFSSGLSGTYQSICMAAKSLQITSPKTKVFVIDSLCASMGEGLLLHKAVRMRDAGLSIEETAEKLERLAPHIVHMFTVDDLFHLHRGGRVSKTTAILGTLAGIKPVLHVDDEGHLIMLDKVRGRKKSLRALVDAMEEKMGSYSDENKEDMVFISHGDAQGDAELLRTMVEDRFGFKNFCIHNIGPVIGAHSGPGTIALFFVGEHR